MGTTVAEPDQGIRMRHHLAHRRQRALRIIAERTIQDRAPIILQHPVVGQWRRVNGQPNDRRPRRYTLDSQLAAL